MYYAYYCTRRRKLSFTFEAITKDGNARVLFLAGVCRRDYGRKLKFRSAKYQTQLESRSAKMFSVGNEVDYVKKVREGGVWSYEQYIKHYLSEDTTQDSTQAFYQMAQTVEWFKNVMGVEVLIFLEDGSRQQYQHFSIFQLLS